MRRAEVLRNQPQARRGWREERWRGTHEAGDEDLLAEVVRVSSEESRSQAVSRALEEYLQWHRARRILDLAGSGLWEGNLAEMREDWQQASRPEPRPRAPR
jgi:Arc/MetJ family transcription regulator